MKIFYHDFSMTGDCYVSTTETILEKLLYIKMNFNIFNVNFRSEKSVGRETERAIPSFIINRYLYHSVNDMHNTEVIPCLFKSY